jgi:hypothetical protein
MMAGDVEAVNGLLMEHFPELVVSKGGKRPDLDVYFYVNCMQFIELIRCALFGALFRVVTVYALPNLDVCFCVSCMQIIELIRCKSLMSSQLVLIVPALE